MRGALLPQAEYVVIDEAHRLEEVATDAFGLDLFEPRLRRDLQRVAHSVAVTSALRDPARAEPAERIRADIERALERTTEVFDALGALLLPISGPTEERMRITAGLRASDDRWLPVELAGERLADAIAGIAFAAERIRNLGGDEDELDELAAAMRELAGARAAITRGPPDPRSSHSGSHASRRDASARLGALESEGLAVLTQGIDGSRRALLERFAQGRAVLLGTQSFWEGVDLPGDILRCVVIVRLPFSVPDDPLVQGRAERYDDPFVQFQLPQAALRLRQGFGRLIRTNTDYGAVVLLDRRVVPSDYGEVLPGSLPDARTEHLPLDGIAARVAAWCDRG